LSREIPGKRTNQNQRQADAIKTAKKVTRMMMTVVLYMLYLFPFFVREILYYFDCIEEKLAFILLSVFVIAFAYSGLSPYIYLSFNQKFRSGFKTLFGNC